MKNFIKEVEGRPYALSVKDMVLHRSTTARPTEIEENRGFFCSELIAKAFKYVGLMEPTEEACSNFKPVHFS